MKRFWFFTKLNNSSLSSLLIISFPFLLLRHEFTGFLSLLLLSIIGLYEAIKNKKFVFNITSIKNISVICWSFLLFIIISNFVYDLKISSNSYIKQQVVLGLSPLIAYGLMTSKISLRLLIPYVKMALILAAIYVIYKNLGQPVVTDRVLWPSWMGVLLFIFTLIKIGKKRKNIYLHIIDLIYSFLIIFAIFESASRGPALTMILLLPIVFILNRHLNDKRINDTNFIDFIKISFVIILCFFISKNFHNRINEIGKKMQSITFYGQNLETEKIDMSSTFDQRKILLQSGFSAFLEKPFFGHGYQNTNKIITKYFPEEIKQTYLFNMTHVHNSYINILVQGGVFGIILYVYLFCLKPFFIFLKALMEKKHKYYSALGILLIIGYCILGITETMYLGLGEILFYIFFLSYLLNKSGN